MAERDDEENRRIIERLDRTERILWGGHDDKPGLVYIVAQLTNTVSTQALQIASKMDIVVDENNQPVSITILANDIGHIKKGVEKGMLWLAFVGFAAVILLGRTVYNVFPFLHGLDK